MASFTNPNPSLLLFSLPLLLLFGGCAAVLEAATPSPSNGTTVYELLPKYGLPPGLLPDTVTSFQLSNDGRFVVELEGACYVEFEYLVYYEPRITGVVKYGSIEDLQGIQVRRFFIWFDVEAIKVDLPPSDFIYFDVGWITKKLSVGQFETVHSCEANVLADRAMMAADSLLKLPDPMRDTGMLVTE
ncbi:uncharacterized protein LOC103712069 [Phoenix dactylifera]|uniref:Uncharacterized protein LOC103712069 n=1 Tax=Phoenix dactylifera TaxID=42345 RepID=A0A8B7CD54_PHODC|nr:uncharacterized protein LOC103712069 [Phoenix dactylifera]